MENIALTFYFTNWKKKNFAFLMGNISLITAWFYSSLLMEKMQTF